jgi:hypothetical protein
MSLIEEDDIPSYEDAMGEDGGVIMMGDDSILTKEMIVQEKMLSCLGRHPLAQSHAYLYFQCIRKGVSNIEVLQEYPLLVYVDVSDNNISNLDVFEKMNCLQQLNARYVFLNELSSDV